MLKKSWVKIVFAEYLDWVVLVSKLFEILPGPLFASFLPKRCVKSGHVMALSSMRRYRETQEDPETVHRCRLIPAGRSLRPFADLIYGAILMSKNTTCTVRVSRLEIPSGFWPFPSLSLYRCFSPSFLLSLFFSFLMMCVYKYRVLAHPQSAILDARLLLKKFTHVPRRSHVCARSTVDRAQPPVEYDCIADIINRRCVPSFSVSFGELRMKLASSPTSSKYDLSLLVACTLLSRVVPTSCHSRFDLLDRSMKITSVFEESNANRTCESAGVLNPEW